MHLQGFEFVAEARASEHFQLAAAKTQKQLLSYLQLPTAALEKEGMPSGADYEAKRAWIFSKAATEYSVYVADVLQRMSSVCQDITTGHQQQSVAALSVSDFVKKERHSLEKWTKVLHLAM